MTVRFRVRAHAPGEGEMLIYELFDSSDVAEDFYRGLIAEDTILQSAGFRAVVVSYEELVRGEWVTASIKLMDFE